MARDHRLDISNYKPSTNPTCRPDRDRSRSPKRPRSDSWRPSSTVEDDSIRNNSRRWRGEAKNRTLGEYRERSPVPSHDAKPQENRKKSRKKNEDQGNGTRVTGLSDKIHSLRRLLDKATDMPADIRQEKERELQGYVADQQRNQARREKNAVTSRYHFVRFMERKKADRIFKRMEKNLGTVMTATDIAALAEIDIGARNGIDEDNAEGSMEGIAHYQALSSAERLALQQHHFRQRLHEAKVDLNYTLYAPLDQKYISLFPPSKNGKAHSRNSKRRANLNPEVPVDDDEAGVFRNNKGERPPLWYEVEKAMETDSLEALRDGKLLKAEGDMGRLVTFRNMAEMATGKRLQGIEATPGDEDGDEDEDEASDGDFFER